MNMPTSRNTRNSLAALFLSFLFVWGDASATSIREASMAEMTDRSAVIFEGVVVEVRAHKSGRGSIVTDVVFEVLDVIKGSVPHKRLKLEFLGGEIDGAHQSVAAMNYPRLGEQGIYFAEAIDRPLINPLYGWDQGRFLILRDDAGTGRVTTADRRPVRDVQGGESVFFDVPGTSAKLSTGVASGVRASAATVSVKEGLSAGEFKRRIRNLRGISP